MEKEGIEQSVLIRAGAVGLEGVLALPPNLWRMVMFAQAAGAGRSMGNLFVARVLRGMGIGTLVFDLLTPEEDSPERRICVSLLAARLHAATSWFMNEPQSERFSFGYLGVEAGAAAAIKAAAEPATAGPGNRIGAVVSIDGWPDLAGEALGLLRPPVLLLAGADDETFAGANRKAYDLIGAEKAIRLFPGAARVLETPDALREAAHLAAQWFEKHLV
jgi:putative phosphoribosyl transferase